MPTNYDRASLEITGTFTVPISYSTLSLFDSIAHKDQIEIYRTNIETIYETEFATTITLTRDEKNDFGIIKPEWITYDEVNKTITAIAIPTSQPFTLENSTTINYPAMVVGEPLVIRRRVVNSDTLVEWITGSRITAEQLNLLSSQLIGIGQENRFELEEKVVKLEDAGIEYATPAYVDATFDTLADRITLPSGIENANNRDKCLVVLSRIGSENIPQAAASLKWDTVTSQLELIGLASQTQNRLEFLASDGTTLINYFNPRGVLNNAGRVYYGSTTPTAPNAADTGLLWWDTSAGNQVLKAWNGSSWDSLTVGAGSYVTIDTTQTISGAKTFSAATTFTNSVTVNSTGNILLGATADIRGSGASKSILLRPTSSGSVVTTVLTATDSQVSVATGKALDYDTLSATAKTITCTLADNQTITGVKTINTHLVLGPSTTYGNQSNILTTTSAASSDGSNLVMRINGSATTRYVKINKETETTTGIELRPKNQAGNGSTYLQGPTIQNDGDFTLGATSRIRNLKNCRIPGSAIIFGRNAANFTSPLGNIGGLPSIPEATITCTQTGAGVVSVAITNTGTTEQQYRITWEQIHPATVTTGTVSHFIVPVGADTITLAGGANTTWTITTSHSGTYNANYHTKIYVTVIY